MFEKDGKKIANKIENIEEKDSKKRYFVPIFNPTAGVLVVDILKTF